MGIIGNNLSFSQALRRKRFFRLRLFLYLCSWYVCNRELQCLIHNNGFKKSVVGI